MSVAQIIGVRIDDWPAALSELGDRGAANSEIIPFSGHDITSRVLSNYVKPGREASRRALAKRGTKPEE